MSKLSALPTLDPSSSLVNATEHIKLNPDNADTVALKALESVSSTATSIQCSSVFQAENLHRRLIKAGSDGKQFYSKAQAMYPYSTYFEGKNKDKK
jgi:hypothetical protein